MKDLRIASFLPAATEMICALGLFDQLVCITHECDFPPRVKEKPLAVRCTFDVSKLSPLEIDQAVTEHMREGRSIYRIDEKVLKETAPNLIVTQELCAVCAPSGNEAVQALAQLLPKPEIIYQTPRSFEEVLQSLLNLGQKTGTESKAKEIVEEARQRIERVSEKIANITTRPSVFLMEWVDPIFCGGHWIPQMIHWAGGKSVLSRDGTDSVKVDWNEIVQSQPEVLIIAPCGYDTDKSQRQASFVKNLPGWDRLHAVRHHQVYAVNANAYFSRPGLRLVDGVELLAHLLHSNECEWAGPADAFRKIL